MRTFRRGYAAIAGLATLAIVVAACGGSASTSSGSSSSVSAGDQGLNPGSGTPQKGGTLNMLGVGDVDYMDYNISYYSIGYLGLRPWLRGLYAYPAIVGKTTTTVPDLATAAPTISSNGLTYTVTIRTGAMWDTSPPRQITAADALLGLKRSCNPAHPFGGIPDFENLIVGLQDFCNNFAKIAPTAAAIKNYIGNTPIPGVTASGQTITYKLVHPASYFTPMLGLEAFNPAPAESLNYIPGSAAGQQHTIADGPYTVQSYTPTHSIVYVRNPAWHASTDPIRKAYVDKIVVTETGTQETNQQQLQTNTAAASMEFDADPPISAVPGLIAQMNTGGKNFNLGPEYSTNPYLVFNTVSPNNNSALAKVAVRQALSYGINRAHLIQGAGGPQVSPPLTHVLPPGINGSQDVPAGYNPYPYEPGKATAMLAKAGYGPPHGLTLKMLYRPSNSIDSNMFQTLQNDLSAIGVKLTGVGVPAADFYTKYLEAPSVAHAGTWDIALGGWSPDWYGDAALSFFNPLFSGPPSYPPSGSNFGFYNDPATSAVIQKGAVTASASAAAPIWAEADQKVMADAAIYPITDPQLPLYHASYVHNAVYVPQIAQFDPTNIWLSTP